MQPIPTIRKSTIADDFRQDRRRWYRLSILLGILFVTLVATGLYFEHRTINAYKADLTSDGEWIDLYKQLSEIVGLATEANAPGNDIFLTGNVDQEAQRFEQAAIKFLSRTEQFVNELQKAAPPNRANDILAPFAAVTLGFEELQTHALALFDAYQDDETRLAGESMARMDQAYAGIIRDLLPVFDAVGRLQQEDYALKISGVEQRRLIGLATAGLSILIVLVAAAYAFVLRRRISAILSRQTRELVLAEDSRSKLEAILATAKDAIITIDEKGFVQSYNAAAAELFGYSANEVISNNVSMLMPEPYRSQHDGYVGAYVGGGQAKVIGIGGEVEGQRKNGETFPMELSITEVATDGGRLFTGFVRDVTERKNNEEIITRSNLELDKKATELKIAKETAERGAARLQAILDTAKDAIITVGKTGIVQSYNAAAAELFGYSANEVIGNNVSMLMPEPYRSEHDGYIGAYVGGGRAKVIGIGREVEGQRKNGETFPMELSITEVATDGDRLFTGFVRDVTERKNNEVIITRSNLELDKKATELKTAKETAERGAARLQAILDTANDAIITVDKTGIVQSYNAAAADLFGYSEIEVVGNNVSMLMPDPYRGEHDGYIGAYVGGGRAKIIGIGREVVGQRKNGETFPMELSITEVATDGDRLFTGFVRDITERKGSEESIARYTNELEFQTKELNAAKEVAERAAKLKSEFLANMSHEIRTPMNGIIGMANLVADTDLNEKQQHFVATIQRSAETLLQLINDILDFSKIEAEKIELEIVPFDMLSVVEDVVDLVTTRALEKQIELFIKYPIGTARYVQGDSGRVRQILLNLLGNSIKFTEEGHVLIEVRSTSDEQGNCLFDVAVEDTGIGMTQESLDRIFEKFGQADSSITRQYGGTGLGLSISRQLATMMDGTLTATSAKGVGSTFRLSLSLAKDQRLPSPVPIPDLSGLAGMHVLIVEPDFVWANLLKDELQSVGSRVSVATSGGGAIQLLKRLGDARAEFDLLFINYDVEDADGNVLAQALKNDPKMTSIPLVVLSNTHRNIAIEPLKRMGVAGLLNTPFATLQIVMAAAAVMTAHAEKKLYDLFVTRHTFRTSSVQRKRTNGTTRRFDHRHILLVEDNAVNQDVATIMLQKLGCSVTPAGNGTEAVRCFMQQDFDLIFMDCQMPILDGFGATRKIREIEQKKRRNKTPIVAFTANAMKGDLEECLAAGMDDYITKPVRSEVLHSVLSKWLLGDENADCSEDITAPAEVEAPLAQAKDRGAIDAKTLFALKALMTTRLPGLVEKFLANGANAIDEARLALNQSDTNAIARAVHPLKSSSASLGAVEVSALAAEIEQKAGAASVSDDDLAAIPAMLERLGISFVAARDALQADVELDQSERETASVARAS